MIGPSRPAACTECGGSAGISTHHAALSLLPFFASLVFAASGASGAWVAVFACALGAATYAWIFIKCVPLAPIARVYSLIREQ